MMILSGLIRNVLRRVTGGRRRILRVSEITGMEGNTICLHDLFQFKQTAVGSDGHAEGEFQTCGVRPRVLERLQAEGFSFPSDMFRRRVLKANKTV